MLNVSALGYLFTLLLLVTETSNFFQLVSVPASDTLFNISTETPVPLPGNWSHVIQL